MERDFNQLTEDEQLQITRARSYFNNYIDDESPEKQTADFETEGGRRKAAFKLIELPDRSKSYEFAYMLYL